MLRNLGEGGVSSNATICYNREERGELENLHFLRYVIDG